jgi:hypothetical protein
VQRLLAEHGEIQLSALGYGRLGAAAEHIIWVAAQAAQHLVFCFRLCHAAVATLVTVAELLKKDKLAVERSECPQRHAGL